MTIRRPARRQGAGARNDEEAAWAHCAMFRCCTGPWCDWNPSRGATWPICPGLPRRTAAPYDFTWVPRGDEARTYLHSQFQRAVEGNRPVRADPHDGSTGGGLHLLRQPPYLAEPARDGAVEIGWTWSPHGPAPGINVESKLLLFAHAFERWMSPASTSRPMRATRGPVAPRRPRRTLRRRVRSWSESWVPGKRPVPRFRHVFGHCSRVAIVREAPPASTGSPPLRRPAPGASIGTRS